MNQISKEDLLAEIERVSNIIETTKSPYLRRDMEKYLKRLKKELFYGNRKRTSRTVI